MYSYTRNPNPSEISCDVKTFLTPLRNYYTQRGNSFYNIEVGKKPPNMIQLQINYANNTINVKEGNNFKINLVSSLFKKGNVVNVTSGGKTQPYQLQKDQNYAKNNMKLYCDPNFGYDSYINIGNYDSEVSLAYVPKPAFAVSQTSAPVQVAPAKPNLAPVKKAEPQLPKVSKPTQNGHNHAQYIDAGKNGMPYLCIKFSETQFAWSTSKEYWVLKKKNGSLMGKDIFHCNKVYYLDPKAHFFDVPKANYFVILRHFPYQSSGMDKCRINIKVDDKEVLNNDKFYAKNYNKIKGKTLVDELVMNINSNSFNNSDNHQVIVQIFGENTIKKNYDLDGCILLPDNCDGKLDLIYNQYFTNFTLFKG